nr:MAG TPA: hypothetical protein [Caudoviricetes sp.]
MKTLMLVRRFLLVWLWEIIVEKILILAYD